MNCFNFFVKQDKYKNENIATRKGRNIAFFNLVLMWPRAQRQKLEGNVATLHKLGWRTGKRLMLMMMMVMVMMVMMMLVIILMMKLIMKLMITRTVKFEENTDMRPR